MPLPSVDVIINNYNYGSFLKEAIDGSLGQTYPDVRVIVVDDGSTDESRNIIKIYGRRVVPILKTNGGQASAVNAGWAASRGDVVVFLDADDVLLSDAAARVAAAFAAQPGLAKVQCRMVIVDAAGNRTGRLHPPLTVSLPSGNLVNEELVFPFDLPWMATSGNWFPRWVLEQLLPMPEGEYPLCVDSYLKHLATLFGPVLSLEEPAAAYRVHGGNSFELAESKLNLDHIRQNVRYNASTRHYLVLTADTLHIARPEGEILSVADLADRLISLKLDRASHTLPEDTVPALVVAGARAAARRWDVRWPVKVVFMAWFVALAISPRRLSGQLARAFQFPELRGPLNRVIDRFGARRRTSRRATVDLSSGGMSRHSCTDDPVP